MEKLIITVAPTGNVPTKELNPNSVITNDEIVDDLVKCRALGASLAHLHVRDNEGNPTSDRSFFKDLVERIHEKKLDMITQLSTGARGGGAGVEWRGQMLDLSIEMASLATGSSNFPTSVNANDPKLVIDLASKMLENNIKPEIEVFDVAMIRNAERLLRKGYIKGPLHFNLVMNVPGSIPGTPRNLMFLVESLPQGSTFTVCGIGPAQIPMLTMAILLGGHVRTGLEDVLKFDGNIDASNPMLIERVVNLAKILGREIATPQEAREILSLEQK